MSAPRSRSGQLAAEAAAVVGAGCVALHAATGLAGGGEDVRVRVVLLAMAAGCVPCIRRLRRGPTRRAWAMTGGMYAGMLTAHLVLLAPWSGTAVAPHHMSGPLTWAALGMWCGLGLAAVEVALAGFALAARLEVGQLT